MLKNYDEMYSHFSWRIENEMKMERQGPIRFNQCV